MRLAVWNNVLTFQCATLVLCFAPNAPDTLVLVYLECLEKTLGARETLSHIAQSCARTHLLRTARHESVLDFTEESCRKNGHDYVRESTIPTSAGVRRPDLIVLIGECAHVVDLTISADHVHLKRAYDAKVRYYDQPDIRHWVQLRFRCESVAFSALVYTWRGCTILETVGMLDKLGVSRYQQVIPVVRVLTDTANMFKQFTRSTTRH